MKICIVGAGAIGGIVAAYCARAGFEVSAIARGAHRHAIEARGLKIIAPQETFSAEVRVNDDPDAFGVQDIVVISLKAHHIPAMLPRLSNLIGRDTIVLPTINGVPWWYFFRQGGPFDGQHIEAIDPAGAGLTALDSHHLIGCVVHAAGEVAAPGEIKSNGSRVFVMGEPDGALSRRLNGLADVFRQAQLEPRPTQHIRDEVWMKLIGNATFNPLCALTRATLRDASENPTLVSFIREAMVEITGVAKAHGANELVTIDKRLEIARKVGPIKPSMLQDLELGRLMEIEPLLGAVVELAEKINQPVPKTQLLYALMRELEKNIRPSVNLG